YCKQKFEECTYHFIFDKTLLKEMIGFSGWNFIGASSGILRDQGVNILLNLFCGPAVNAARGIAFQVSAAVSSFVLNFSTALNPQIMKSYAKGNNAYMMTLIYRGSRLSVYLLLFLSLPVLMETKYILSLWLNMVPEYTVVFVRLILLYVICESISYTLVTAMLATGKIRNYQIVVGGFQLLNFPISYGLLYYKFPPESTLYIAIIIALFCLLARLYMLRPMIDISAYDFLHRVFLNELMVGVMASVIPLIIVCSMKEGFIRFMIVGITCILMVSL
ncbi:MAG: lipopolysaccharide biosynthesis protein, partial [Bacteroidales bacterium]